MWGQQGFWPPVDPAVSTLPAGHHQDPSYRPNYGSLPAQPHLWYPNYGQEQTPYPYKPYPSQAMDGGSTMHSGFSRSPPSITPNRPLAPTSNLKTFLTPPNNSERDSREELTPPDSDGDREDKPFQCGFPKCSYETNRRNNLKRHMATMHEKLNAPHVCCGFTFYRKADMRAHTKEVHVEGERFPFQVSLNVSFFLQDTLASGQDVEKVLCERLCWIVTRRSTLERSRLSAMSASTEPATSRILTGTCESTTSRQYLQANTGRARTTSAPRSTCQGQRRRFRTSRTAQLITQGLLEGK